MIQTRLTPASLTYNKGSGTAEALACMYAIGLSDPSEDGHVTGQKATKEGARASHSFTEQPKGSSSGLSESKRSLCSALSTSFLSFLLETPFAFSLRKNADYIRARPRQLLMSLRDGRRKNPPPVRVGLDAQELKHVGTIRGAPVRQSHYPAEGPATRTPQAFKRRPEKRNSKRNGNETLSGDCLPPEAHSICAGRVVARQ